jgi:phage repressor protein C with HTH and peptisase S24 domain
MSESIGTAHEIALRLREEIDRLGGISPVARQIGVHRNTVASWCQSGAVSTTDLNRLSAWGLDAHYVVFGRRVIQPLSRTTFPSPSQLGLRSIEEMRPLGNGGLIVKGTDEDGAPVEFEYPATTGKTESAASEFALIPYYDITAAAGHGRAILQDPEAASTHLAYRHEWLHARNLTAGNLFEMSVAGDSMEPELRTGDTVLVDRSQKDIRGGAIYVLRVGDDLVIKYLQRLPGGRVQVSSENSDAYPSYEVTQQHFESGEVEVLGRVVRQGRDR